jgi:hypothetical protein
VNLLVKFSTSTPETSTPKLTLEDADPSGVTVAAGAVIVTVADIVMYGMVLQRVSELEEEI